MSDDLKTCGVRSISGAECDLEPHAAGRHEGWIPYGGGREIWNAPAPRAADFAGPRDAHAGAKPRRRPEASKGGTSPAPPAEAAPTRGLTEGHNMTSGSLGAEPQSPTTGSATECDGNPPLSAWFDPHAADDEEPWEGGLFRDEIQCPHCNTVDREFTDYPNGLNRDGDTAAATCWNCGREMTVTVSVSYSFATEPANTVQPTPTARADE